MMTRRYFLQSSGIAIAGLGIAPSWLLRATTLGAQDRNKRKVLVAIFQRGGIHRVVITDALMQNQAQALGGRDRRGAEAMTGDDDNLAVGDARHSLGVVVAFQRHQLETRRHMLADHCVEIGRRVTEIEDPDGVARRHGGASVPLLDAEGDSVRRSEITGF